MNEIGLDRWFFVAPFVIGCLFWFISGLGITVWLTDRDGWGSADKNALSAFVGFAMGFTVLAATAAYFILKDSM